MHRSRNLGNQESEEGSHHIDRQEKNRCVVVVMYISERSLNAEMVQ